MPLLSFGSNAHGQLSTNTLSDTSLPTICQIHSPPLLDLLSRPPLKIACGANHTAVITASGQLLTCGINNKGQLGFESAAEDVLTLREVKITDHKDQSVLFTDVGCGWDFTIVLDRQGILWGCGSNESGQLGLGESSYELRPIPFDGIEQGLQKLACGLRHCLSIDKEGHVWGWGSNRFGEAGVSSSADGKPPRTVQSPSLVVHEACKEIACGRHHSILLTINNEVLVIGKNKHGVLGSPISTISMTAIPTRVTLPPEAANADLKKVFAGWGHSGVLTSNGKIYMWGRCDHGQLAEKISPPQPLTSSILHTHVPIPCTPLLAITDVFSASENCLALDVAGRCWAWGWNEHGNCGVGHLKDVVVPDVVKVSAKVQTVGCGHGHALIWVPD